MEKTIDDIILLGYEKTSSSYNMYRNGATRLYVDSNGYGDSEFVYSIYPDPRSNKHQMYDDIDEVYKVLKNIKRSNIIKKILSK
jgi:hypothetical protein